eukprot:1918965-Prymnesium_polylepis.1
MAARKPVRSRFQMKRALSQNLTRPEGGAATDHSANDDGGQLVMCTYSDRCGVLRKLALSMPRRKAVTFVEGLQMLQTMVPMIGSAAHWRWALSCMSATSMQGATGLLRRSELRILLQCANASPQFTTDELEKALQSVQDGEQLMMLPTWLRVAPVSNEQQQKALNVRQITEMLLCLCTNLQKIKELFHRYATDGWIDLAAWLNFVRDEQLLGNYGEDLAHAHDDVHFRWEAEDQAELGRAHERFTGGSTGAPQAYKDKGLRPIQFTLLLMNPQNNGTAPVRANGSLDDVNEPIAHYWTACSHNSCTLPGLELWLWDPFPLNPITGCSDPCATDIVGDQLTGLSTHIACISAGTQTVVFCTVAASHRCSDPCADRSPPAAARLSARR